MLKEYIKPELIENSKFKAILEEHSDKILSIIKQEDITYEDFRKLVRNVFAKENSSKEGLYTYERELKKLYDSHALFKRSLNKKERAQKVIEALWELSNNKYFQE